MLPLSQVVRKRGRESESCGLECDECCGDSDHMSGTVRYNEIQNKETLSQTVTLTRRRAAECPATVATADTDTAASGVWRQWSSGHGDPGTR